jgi:hypothetical protein
VSKSEQRDLPTIGFESPRLTGGQEAGTIGAGSTMKRQFFLEKVKAIVHTSTQCYII